MIFYFASCPATYIYIIFTRLNKEPVHFSLALFHPSPLIYKAYSWRFQTKRLSSRTESRKYKHDGDHARVLEVRLRGIFHPLFQSTPPPFTDHYYYFHAITRTVAAQTTMISAKTLSNTTSWERKCFIHNSKYPLFFDYEFWPVSIIQMLVRINIRTQYSETMFNVNYISSCFLLPTITAISNTVQ